MSDQPVIVETIEAGVRLIRLNRPERRNALATAMLGEIAAHVAEADRDGTIKVIVLTGGPTVFAAGADIDELALKTPALGLEDERCRHWASIRATRKPVIAAVNGWCLGAGNELLMCCDLAIAGENARFGQPEINLGIIPGAGGTALLPRLVGKTRAMQMVLLGETISAGDAREAGLVNQVVADSAVLAAALDLATRLAARAPLAVMQAKASINAALETPLTAHHGLERQAFALTLGSEDKAEGVRAFKEKRLPAWQSR